MKKLQLPINNTFSMFFRSDLSDLTPVKTEDGKTIFPIGTIDCKALGEQADAARHNAALVIWAVISIEQRFNNLIANYLFGLVVGEPKPKRDFFIHHFLNSNAVELTKKKALVFEIVSQAKFLDGKEKDQFSKLFAKVIKYRNAFAHGSLSVDVKFGTRLTFFSGTHQQFTLNDEFWTGLENEFQELNDLILNIEKKLNDQFLESIKTSK